MAKITKIDVKTSTYQGKEKKSYLFTLDDGVGGFLSNNNPESFREGDEVTYTKEVKKSGQGKDYNVLTLTLGGGSNTPPANPAPRPQAPAPVVVPQEATVLKMKFESRMKCLELAHNAYLSGKLDDKEALEHCVAWVAVADGLINEITGK
jgi:hypothetical protein